MFNKPLHSSFILLLLFGLSSLAEAKLSLPSWLEASYTWDAASRPTHITHFNGTTTYSWDDANRLIAIHDQKSDGTTISRRQYMLDANGNRIQEEQEQPQSLPIPTATSIATQYSYTNNKTRLTQQQCNTDGNRQTTTYSHNLEDQQTQT